MTAFEAVYGMLTLPRTELYLKTREEPGHIYFFMGVRPYGFGPVRGVDKFIEVNYQELRAEERASE